jgi:hypothetical protein
MKPSDDYPRMLFHRTREAVTVHSREEEEALGAEWSRRVWPPPSAEPFPHLPPFDELEANGEEEDDEEDPDSDPPPAEAVPPVRKHPSKRATKPAKKKR